MVEVLILAHGAEAALAADHPPTRAAAAGWRVIASDGGLRVMASASIKARRLGERGWVVGDLFARNGARAPDQLPISDPTSCGAFRALASGWWGRYLACFREDDGRWSVLRDPSGMLDACAWRSAQGVVVGSCIPDWVKELGPSNLAIDWRVVARMLVDRAAMAAESGLLGITTIEPGTALELESFRTSPIWNATAYLAHAEFSAEAAQDVMRDTVNLCVAAWAGGGGTIATEVSGGFDSSLVTALLVRSNHKPVLSVNYFTDGVSGDEREFASALAHHLGVTLDYAPRSSFKLTTIPEAAVTSFRPNVTALDTAYEEDIVKRALAVGATVLMTGQGGDTVFHQNATRAVVIDEWRRGGFGALFPGFLAQTGRRVGASIWDLLGDVARDTVGAWRPTGREGHGLLSDQLSAYRHDPAIPPAKAAQIEALRVCRNYFTLGGRERSLDVVHPLLSQPIVELSLALPVALLTLDARDRGLARAAFHGLLPEAIIRRRSKGTSGVYYARSVVRSLPFLKGFLLEGRLVARGLLKVADLEAALEPGYMMWRGTHADILHAAAIEGWIRHWEARADLFNAAVQ